MATLSTKDAIVRFDENEDRLNTFINSYGTYSTNSGLPNVETLPSFMQRNSTALNLLASTNVRGAWASSTVYSVWDEVQYSGTWYRCVVAHTSTGTFDSTKWRVSQGIRSGDLSDSNGASLVGFGSTTVKDILDSISLNSYSNLRTYAGSASSVFISGYSGATTPSGIAGHFTVDSSDTTSLDNGGTVIVDGTGRRWKRQYDGAINAAWFGAVAGSADSYAGLQAALNFCASASQGSAKALYISGKHKCSQSLVIPKEFITIFGDGQWETEINFDGVAGGCLKTAALTYLRPHIHDMGFTGNAATGKGIDFSNVSGQVYLGSLRNLYIQSGGDGFYAPRFFSMVVDNVASYSYSGHCFRAQCGPSVSWINCYALTCGLNKAGYRLGGQINMFACNGLNDGDYWGVFGSDPTRVDPFQNDFSSVDLPDINLIGCNIEHFGSLTTAGEGIRVQNVFRNLNVIGGKVDRADLSTSYSAVIRLIQPSNGATQPAKLNFGSVFKGSGVPSLAYLYTDTFATFYDENDSFVNAGITSFSQAGTVYPLMRRSSVGDIYGGIAFADSAISPRRLSAQMIRYNTPAALTPVGTGQNIVVTGYSKVIVSPAAAASIYSATFDATTNATSDFGRNGDLIIEAGNANLTILHTPLGSGGNTFVLSGGANLTLGTGKIVRFCRSETTGQWIQT